MDSVVLLLTATIHVGDCIFVGRTNAVDRQNDYLDALTWFLENTSLPIVWCENSGAETSFLDQLRSEYGDRLEILSYLGNQDGKHYGKGYGERQTILEALTRSKYQDPKVRWVKVTGRLRIPNILEILESTLNSSPEYEIFSSPITNGHCRSEVFIFSSQFFRSYMTEELIDDLQGKYFEHALANSTQRYHRDHPEYPLIPLHPLPILDGISGTSNQRYNR